MGMLGNSYSTEQSTNSSDLAPRAEVALAAATVRTLGGPPSPTDASRDGNLADAGGIVGSGRGLWLAAAAEVAGICFLTAFTRGSVFAAHADLPASSLWV